MVGGDLWVASDEGAAVSFRIDIRKGQAVPVHERKAVLARRMPIWPDPIPEVKSLFH
jgi:hypothetical protein